MTDRVHGKTGVGIVATATLLASAVAYITPHTATYEGLRTHPYHDAGGVMTVCYGETHVPMHDYTKAECVALLQHDLEIPYGKAVAKCIPQFDRQRIHALAASIDTAYNVGIDAFCHSKAAQLFRAQKYDAGCTTLVEWRVTAKGVHLAGLERRRREDADLCREISND